MKGSPRLQVEPPASQDTRVGMRGPRARVRSQETQRPAPRTPTDARMSKSPPSSGPPGTPSLQKRIGQDERHAPAASTGGISAQTNPDTSRPLSALSDKQPSPATPLGRMTFPLGLCPLHLPTGGSQRHCVSAGHLEGEVGTPLRSSLLPCAAAGGRHEPHTLHCRRLPDADSCFQAGRAGSASSTSVAPGNGMLPSIPVLTRLNWSELRPPRLPSSARLDGHDTFESKPALTPRQTGRITQHHVAPRAPQAVWPTAGANPLQECPRRRTTVPRRAVGGRCASPPAVVTPRRGTLLTASRAVSFCSATGTLATTWLRAQIWGRALQGRRTSSPRI